MTTVVLGANHGFANQKLPGKINEYSPDAAIENEANHRQSEAWEK